MKQQLLREYVRGLLLELGGGEGSGGLYYLVEPNQLFGAFAGPFTDILKVGTGELKKNLSALKLGAKIVLGSFANMVPGYKADFQKMFKVHNEEVKAVESQYKQFYDRALKVGNTDLAMATFLFSPGVFLAAGALGKAGGKLSRAASFAGSIDKDEAIQKAKKKIRQYVRKEGEDSPEALDAKKELALARKLVRARREEERKKKKQGSSGSGSKPTSQQGSERSGQSESIRELTRMLILEGDAKISSEIKSLSEKKKQDFIETGKKIIKDLTEMAAMSPEEFSKKYAAALGDDEKLLKNAEKEIKNIKDKKEKENAPDPKQLIDGIKSSMDSIVLKGKEMVKQGYVESLKKNKKEIEDILGKFSKEFGVKIDPQKHGQTKMIDQLIEKIEEIKVT